MKRNKKIASIILPAATMLLLADTAFAQESINIGTGIAHWQDQGNTLFKFLMWVCAFFGALMIMSALYGWWALANDKAPQRVADVGMKGVFTGFAVGGGLLGIAWVIQIAAGTVASDNVNNDDLDQLLGSHVIEQRIEVS